ncbi:MAG: glycosyltransferase [Acidimicrobiales bacterium]|nr:glycosyltransferase [Acidimicrobiales bacterium]
MPFASVVVPTHNRASMLRDCLATLVAQDYPVDRYEVLVADDGSTDATPSVIAAFARDHGVVRGLRQEPAGANAARNMGLAEARGDPICFVDDDQEMPPGWLRALVSGAMRLPDAACVGGPIVLRLEGRPPRTCGRELPGEGELDYGSELRLVEEVWGGNLALRRHAVDIIGPFREFRRLGGNEIEWQRRARALGLSIGYVPEARLYHRRTAGDVRLGRLVSRRFFRGWGQARNMARAGEPYLARSELESTGHWLGHWATTGCTQGLVNAAQVAGRLLSIADLAVRRRVTGDRAPSEESRPVHD